MSLVFQPQIPIALLLAYAVGSIPTGYWLVKALKGVDVRDYGSGNIGTTNVKRVAGNKAALAVLFIDMLKGTLPVLATQWLYPQAHWLHVMVALVAIVGHGASMFLNFTGGKASATGLGTLLGLSPIGGACLVALGIGLFRWTRTVSIVSLVLAVLNPFVMHVVAHVPMPYLIYSIVCSLYVIIRHKANIQRLLQGTENRL